METIIVCVAERDANARESLIAAARRFGCGTASYGSVEEMLRKWRSDLPSCVVLDLADEGWETLARLSTLDPPPPVICLSEQADAPTAVRALRLGALTLLSKPPAEDAFCAAIEEAAVADARRREERESMRAMEVRLSRLNPTERRVLDLVLEGAANKTVAQRLGVAQRTVERARAGILRKLGVDTAVAAARVIAEHQIRDRWRRFDPQAATICATHLFPHRCAAEAQSN